MSNSKKPSHIDIKDSGIKASQKVGDVLSDFKSLLEHTIIRNLLIGKDETNLVRWKMAQNNALNDFRINVSSQTKKVKNEVKTILSDKDIDLKPHQVASILKELNGDIISLKGNAIRTYQNTIKDIDLKIDTASDLRNELERHIKSGVKVDVIYKNGKNYKFDSYWEMKVRTDVQNDIGNNMVNIAKATGNIFFISAFFGDCAKDHADYQGKIYVDKDWKTNAPKDRVDEIQSYIDSNKILTVQEVMVKPIYLTTRPNCRHYFDVVDIDSVLGATNDKKLNELRQNKRMNFNGKYRPEKYEALQKQRYNERKIRSAKEEIEKNKELLALNPDDSKLQQLIKNGEARVRSVQTDQRKLIKQYDNLERDYYRESNNIRGNFRIK